eukprot:TRINITY_DN6564_c0_g2_i2.p1 TRINITY_DN6564_c0_g2~~TRINITY_DN6564_c0_g2_i2.p1  ORF type:complete len:143 (-),score=17.47 TRINITY_DN6564_c0_g2_i2:141-569(-)
MKQIYSILKDPTNDISTLPLSQPGRDIYRVHHSTDLKRHNVPSFRRTFAGGKQSCAFVSARVCRQRLSSSFAAVGRENTSIAINLVRLSGNCDRDASKRQRVEDTAANTHKLIRICTCLLSTLQSTSMTSKELVSLEEDTCS